MVALLLSINPNLTSDEVIAAIVNNVDSLASVTGKTVSGGIVNAYKAVASISQVADSTAPTVSSTDPSNGSTGVFTSKTITINFSENVAAGANLAGVSLSDSISSLPVNLSIVGDKLTIVSSNTLAYSTAYTVYLPAGVVNDLAGNALVDGYSFTFTTGADLTGPTLVSTDPANKTTSVPLTKLIKINFNENISTVNFSAITIKKSKTTIAFTGNINGSTITLTPSKLALGSTYTVTIPAGAVKDSAGNANPASYSFSFTTVRK